MSIQSRFMPHTHIHEQKFDNEELKIIDYIEKSKSQLRNSFLKNIQSGRDGILKRLIASIIRENILGLRNSEIIIHKENGKWGEQHACPTSVMKHLQAEATLYETYTEISALFLHNNDAYLVIPINKRYAFGRVEVNTPISIIMKDGYSKRISHSVEILELLVKEGWEGDQEAIDVFKHDLTNSSANLTFAYAHYENKQQNFMFNELTSHSHAYAFTEQSVIEGHPCHPGAKLKKGLSPSENYQYSAEFQNSIHLAFIAIHHSLVSVATLNNDWNKMLFSYEPSLKATFQETLIKHNKQTEDYFILPIHPWQMEKVIPTMYAAELDKFLLIDVPYNNSAYYAGMSFRTLFPKVIEGLKPHYKLTTNVHLTGEVRTLSEQTIHNGPLMSEILTSITKTDLLINERTFIPIVELGGLHFLKESDNEPLRTERSENLACVIRENLYHYIEENEIPIVGSALLSTNTTNESTLLVQLICQYKQTYEIDCLKDAVHSFLQKYVQNIISGVIPLLVKYGIGLEGHLQNTVPVFHQDGTPTKILIRDWEGIRVDKERLSKAGFDLTKFHAKSRILTDSLKSVRNKVFYSVVQNHIGELILQLTKELRDIDEQFLWNIVKKQIDMTFENLQHNGADVQSINEDRNIFFNKEIDYKAVTTMRMLGEAHEYSYVKVSNPLSN